MKILKLSASIALFLAMAAILIGIITRSIDPDDSIIAILYTMGGMIVLELSSLVDAIRDLKDGDEGDA